MSLSAGIAIAAGAAVLVVLAILRSQVGTHAEASMEVEGKVALGFAALLSAVPLWVVQLIATIVAGGWLWAWWVAAPLIGASPVAGAVVRRVRR